MIKIGDLGLSINPETQTDIAVSGMNPKIREKPQKPKTLLHLKSLN